MPRIPHSLKFSKRDSDSTVAESNFVVSGPEPDLIAMAKTNTNVFDSAPERQGQSQNWLRNLFPLGIVLVLFNVCVFESASIASRAFAVAFLLLVPGLVLMSLTPVRPAEASVRFTLSVATSMLVLMLLGLIYSLVLPHLGIARPLSHTSVVLGVDVVTAFGLIVQARVRDPLDYLCEGHAPSWMELSCFAILALLPIAAAVGAERLNNNHGGGIALVVLVTIGVVVCGLLVYSDRVPGWFVSGMLYSTSAAVLLMASMRSNYPIGSDIQSEYYVLSETLRNGIWHLPVNGNPYAAMLSITVLPATISLATHTSGIYLFKLVYPLIFSVFPVMVYIVSARWFPARAAVVGALVLIVQGFYAADMTGLARQEIGLVYFALLIVVAFDESIGRRPRQVTAVVTGLGLAISHYSTAYFTSAVLVIGFVVQLLFRLSRSWRSRWHILLTLPVVVGIVGVIVLWNVTITRSAQNAVDLANSVRATGFQLLPGNSGSSILSRFLNADVSPKVTPAQIVSISHSYYQAHYSFLHPYPLAISKLYPLKAVTVPGTVRSIPASYGTLVGNIAAGLSEVLLLLIGVGIIVFLWRQRKSIRGERAEFGFIAIGTVLLLAILRLSGTVSTLYNAPRGQVQGAPLLSIGLACLFAWMFAGHIVKRAVLIGVTAICLALLFFSDSGLSDFSLGGGTVYSLENFGGQYESYYFTEADISSAGWVIRNDAKGQVIYADDYGALQLNEVTGMKAGVISSILPQIIEPGAYVYADSTNVVDKTTYANVSNNFSVYQFPAAFLNRVKDVVFSSGTTEVYR